MATFVLVQGAWVGSWYWKKLTPLLRAAGHDVFTPSLTGLGERAHLAVPAVGLETHIEDVLGVLTYEDLSRVILVGHSYGGMVITGVAERAPERPAHLVYFDAFVPANGQALLDLVPAELAAMFREQAQAHGDGWRIPAPPATSPILGLDDPADQAWVGPKLAAQPLRAFEDSVQVGNPAAAAVPRTYIHCTSKAREDPFAPFAARLQGAAGWTTRELATGHCANITMPEQLAELLTQAATSVRVSS
jgi:pimeloyl-ACP methyl ester carboxylesterase